MARLPPPPDLAWTEAGEPRARAFDDVYFSERGGLAESEAVFLAGCGLPENWAGRSRFTICELGFGSGLNALAVWRAWKAARQGHALLHMCTVEAFPLARQDAARALSKFREIEPFAAQLLARWPVRAYAPQRLWFPEDGFALTVLIGEAERVLPGLSGSVDAWFLDGFAPARNESMWSEPVLRQIARLSAPGARTATFTVAGAVRRGLEAVGFAVEKRPGFGAKRERLEARFQGTPTRDAPRPKRVAIVGAGIAGAACADALTRRDVETVVLDEAPALGAGASGNPAGLVMPRLDRGKGAMRELFLAAYLNAIAAYEKLGGGVFTRCGVEERAKPDRPEALADLLDDPPLPEDWFARLGDAALHPRAGLVRPLDAIRAWTTHATLMCEADVAAFERAEDGWLLRASDGRARLKADAVVIACGAALRRFAPASFLPVELSRGQIEWGPLDASPLAHALTRSAYVAPFERGVLFGATFDKVESDAPPPPDGESRARNLNALAEIAPDLAARVHHDQLVSRAALRATTPDRAPIVGELPNEEAWRAYHARGEGTPDSVHHQNLYVLGGYGARGLTLAPLLGETIASSLCNEMQILSAPTRAAIDPARFLHRALRKGS